MYIYGKENEIISSFVLTTTDGIFVTMFRSAPDYTL